MKKNKRLSILQILKTSSLIAIFILGLEASALKENPIVISGLEVKAETEVLEAYKKAQLAKENLEEILSYFLSFGASGKKPTPTNLGINYESELEALEAYKKAQLAKENLEEILSYFLNFGASGKKPTPDKTDLEEIYRELPLKE